MIACSVITVFGADVPDGSWLISWIGGLAMQLPGGQGHGRSRLRCPGLAAAVEPRELHQRSSWTGRAAS